METTTITVALIGAAGAILAAVLPVLLKPKEKEKEPPVKTEDKPQPPVVQSDVERRLAPTTA